MKPNRISLMLDEEEKARFFCRDSSMHALFFFFLLCVVQFVLKCNLNVLTRCEVAIMAKTNDFRFLTRAAVDDGDA